MPACPRPCRTCFTTASACARPPIPFSVRSLPLSLASTTGTGHTRGRRTVPRVVEFKMSGWSSFAEEVRETSVGGLERPHAWLLRLEVVLLRTDDAARANDAQPRYALVCRKPQVLHQPQGNQRAGAPQTCKWKGPKRRRAQGKSMGKGEVQGERQVRLRGTSARVKMA